MRFEKIAIDSCAWNFFFDHKIDLAKEFPSEKFKLVMTKEIAEFELEAIPMDTEARRELKKYIDEQMERANIEIESWFGFSSYSDPPGYKARVGGFNEGMWIDDESAALLKVFTFTKDDAGKTGLYKNEGDASLAVKACTGYFVLTVERPSQSGPLKKAKERGGRVVYLQNWDAKNSSLSEFILETKNGV